MPDASEMCLSTDDETLCRQKSDCSKDRRRRRLPGGLPDLAAAAKKHSNKQEKGLKSGNKHKEDERLNPRGDSTEFALSCAHN